jgi:hypothetical protein
MNKKININIEIQNNENFLMQEHAHFNFAYFVEIAKENNSIGYRDYESNWTDFKKSRFIESLILNVPLPPIIVYENSYNVYEFITGINRTKSFQDFLDDKFALTGLSYWKVLNGKSYSQIEDIVLHKICRRQIHWISIYNNSQNSKLIRKIATDLLTSDFH